MNIKRLIVCSTSALAVAFSSLVGAFQASATSEYTYQDLAIDFIDQCIGLALPLDATVIGLDDYLNAGLNTKAMAMTPEMEQAISCRAIAGYMGYYYNYEGTLRAASFPAFDATQHITSSLCLVQTQDFSIHVDFAVEPDTDAAYMQYYYPSSSTTTTIIAARCIRDGTSTSYIKHLTARSNGYFTGSPWTLDYTGSNDMFVNLANKRANAVVPTLAQNYTPRISTSTMTFELFGNYKTCTYPTGLRDIAKYQLAEPAYLQGWCQEWVNGLSRLTPGVEYPAVPEPDDGGGGTNNNVDIPVFAPVLSPITIDGVAVIGAAAGAVIMGGVNINLPINGEVIINGEPFDIPFDSPLDVDGHEIDFPDDTDFTFDNIQVRINPDGSLTIDGTTYEYPIGQWETTPVEQNQYKYEVEMPTMETIPVDSMTFATPDLAGISDGVSWWWSAIYVVLDSSGLLDVLPIIFGLGLLGYALYKIGG